MSTKKIRRNALFIVTAFLFELLFYIFYFGSNMVIAILPREFEARLLPYAFMNFAVFLSLCIMCMKFKGTKILCKKTLFAVIAVLLAKCVSDIVFAFVKPEQIYRSFICDVFHIIMIFLILSAIAVIRRSDLKGAKGSSALKINLALLLFGTVCLIVSGIVLTSFCKGVYSKYNIENINLSGSYYYNFNYYINGAKELYEIISVFTRSIILIASVNIFNALFEQKEADENIQAKPFIVSGSCLLLCLVLNLCLNTNAVFSGISSMPAVFEKSSGQITVDYRIFSLYRGIGEEKYMPYTTEKNYVYFGNTKVCTFNTSPLAACGWFVDYGDEEQTSVVCQTEIIAYINENGKWEAVKFKDLGKSAENEKLTEVLKNVCASGSLEVIDYALPYFQKYEPKYVSEIKEIIADNNDIFNNGNWILSKEYCTEITEKINSL